jgi:hypothetical protein
VLGTDGGLPRQFAGHTRQILTAPAIGSPWSILPSTVVYLGVFHSRKFLPCHSVALPSGAVEVAPETSPAGAQRTLAGSGFGSRCLRGRFNSVDRKPRSDE